MKKIILLLTSMSLVCGLFAQSVKESDWGMTKYKQPVKLYTLKNKNGMTLKVIDYGAVITQLWVPDRNDKYEDVVLGFDSIRGYEGEHPYFGSVVGRYGNRIAKGTFSIGDKEYTLPINNGVNCLHGGDEGFNKKLWKATTSVGQDSVSVKLVLNSPDGDQGFPGNLKATVTYTLNNSNELIINYQAETDKPTPCNLTQHSYFNLAGEGRGNILRHEVVINADKYTTVDETLIPTGSLPEVAGTPFDFRSPKEVGSRIEFKNEQLAIGGGYDHNFVLNKKNYGEMSFAASVYEPTSGRKMEIYTTEPGVQFYVGNFLDGIKGKGGKAYNYRYGLCLETQHFPDSPNQKDFPSTIITPNKKYDTTTIFKFTHQ